VFGHVDLDAPNGGESFDVGEVVTVQWHVAIQHNTIDWDLWYSIDGPSGPWTTIVADLPAGDPTEGAVHTFDWIVPNDVDETVWVRVRQDNNGKDYFDVSDNPFAINATFCSGDITGPGDESDGSVDALDFLLVIAQWGTSGAEADVTGPAGAPDGVVDALDFLAVIAQWGTPGNCPAP
jgi:hypothetical protein